MSKKIKELVRNIVYILMALQVGFGILWTACNFTVIPDFEESWELLVMAKGHFVDEYTGFLYVLCISGAMLLEKVIKLPACSVLYILQLITAYCAYCTFIQKVVTYRQTQGAKLRKRKFFYGLFILTMPVILQVHMAVLPYSLASSVLVMLLAELCMLWRKDYELQTKAICKIAFLWIIGALICPDYGWIGGIAVVFAFIKYGVAHTQRIIGFFVMIMVSVICINSLHGFFQEPGSMGKIQKTWYATMLTRVVWPNFGQFSYFWKEEIKETWNEAQLRELSSHPEAIIYEFGPTIEEMFGREEANNIYSEMVRRTFELDTKNILMDMAEDSAAYLCPPLTMFVQLQGVGTSYTGWNYGRLRDNTPELTKWYVDISLRGWIYILSSCVFLEILLLKKKKRTERKEWIGAYLCGVSILINLWYMMVSGHMQDYKKVLVISILWGMLVIKVLEDAANKILLNE